MGLYEFLEACCAPVSQRVVIAILVLCGLAIQFVHRLAFHLVLTQITYSFSVDYGDMNSCDFRPSNVSTVVFYGVKHHAEFFWSYREQTILISAYYVGNSITLLHGDFLIEKIGLKRIFGLGVFINAIGSLLTPMCAKINLYALVTIRAVMGLGQGPLILSEAYFSSRWYLKQERHTFSAIMQSGIVVGGIMGFAGTGFMLQYFSDWESVFYCFAFLSLMWYLFWTVFVYDSIEKHPFISQQEKRKLNRGMREITYEEYEITLFKLFKSAPFWAVTLLKFGNGWTFYFILNLLPMYMSNVLKFSPNEIGLFCSLPFATMCLFSACLTKMSNTIVSKGYVSQKLLTDILLSLSSVLSSFSLLSASLAGCFRPLAVFFFSVSMGFIGLEYSGVQVFNKGLALHNVAMIQAVSNSMRALGGIFVPLIFACFIEQSKLQSLIGWWKAFIFTFILASITSVIYLIWGSGNIKNWNYASRAPEGQKGKSSADEGTNKGPSETSLGRDGSSLSIEIDSLF